MGRYKQVTRMEDYERWELDVGRTLLANLVGIFFILLVIIFVIYSFGYVNEIESESGRLTYLIVLVFVSIQIFRMVSYPTLEYKPRGEHGSKTRMQKVRP